MARINRFVLLSFSLFLVMTASAYAEDDYLKMLESEASELELDQSGQINQVEHGKDSDQAGKITKQGWKWDGELDGDTLPSGLAQDELATLLKQNFYGTFVFYRKLNSNDQKTVYYHYSKSPKPDLDVIRKDILDLLKQ